MGMFNMVRTLGRCSDCGEEQDFSVQFKYGNLRQHAYSVGDEILWGGHPQVGSDPAEHVMVSGISDCRRCYREQEWDIEVRNGRIVAALPSNGQTDYLGQPYVPIPRSSAPSS